MEQVEKRGVNSKQNMFISFQYHSFFMLFTSVIFPSFV